MEYKFVELMSCGFQASSEENIKQQVTYRYNAVKSRLALMQARLADINALVSCLYCLLLRHFFSLCCIGCKQQQECIAWSIKKGWHFI